MQVQLYKGEHVELRLSTSYDHELDSWGLEKRRTDNGKVQEYNKVYKGNSRFSAEERTETALLTAVNTYLTKKGYYRTREEAVDAMEQIDSCMLLHKYTDGCLSFPCIAMPKIDGIRCRYQAHVPLTRGGKKITGLDHIHLASDWDGELYVPGFSLEKIQSLVMGNRDKSMLKYFVFDVCEREVPFAERIRKVHREILNVTGKVIPVPYTVCYNQADADKIYREHIANDFEGTVYRDPKGMYECKRSRGVIKRKPLSEDEFQITEVLHDKDNLVYFEVYDEEFKLYFKVVPEWPDELRLIQVDYLNRYLTVQYQGRTAKLVPKFAVGKVTRETKEDGRVIL